MATRYKVVLDTLSQALTGKTINGLTISTTTGTFTLTNAKTLTVSDSTTLATNSITFAGGEVLTLSATNALTLTTTGATNVTLPTTGTLESYADVRYKAVTSTRDLTAASGNVAYTGAGFAPVGAMFFTAVSASKVISWGYDTGSSTGIVVYSAGGDVTGTYDYSNSGGASVMAYVSSGVRQFANILTLDSDGCTLAWTKQGSPTGTLGINILFFR